jgi:hypothetical protein
MPALSTSETEIIFIGAIQFQWKKSESEFSFKFSFRIPDWLLLFGAVCCSKEGQLDVTQRALVFFCC